MRVTLYTKPGCHLCDDALAILDRLAPRYNLDVDEVNIVDDMALYEAYRDDIPVLAIEGGRLGTLRAPIDEAGLRTALEVASRAFPQPQAAGSVLRARRREHEPLIDRVARYIGRHWLRLVVVALAIYVLLPWLAPLFAALGWWDLADPLYTAYALTCHQLPERAGSVFGYQVGFCYRNTALYGGTAMFGAVYALARDHNVSWLKWLRRPVAWWGLVLLLLPMAADGVTHMLGLRDSMMDMDATFGSFYVGSQMWSLNWWLRVVTGLLAALGAVWFAFPRMDRTMDESEAMRMAYRMSEIRSQKSDVADPQPSVGAASATVTTTNN
jgi:uncharacterized membrane protein